MAEEKRKRTGYLLACFVGTEECGMRFQLVEVPRGKLDDFYPEWVVENMFSLFADQDPTKVFMVRFPCGTTVEHVVETVLRDAKAIKLAAFMVYGGVSEKHGGLSEKQFIKILKDMGPAIERCVDGMPVVLMTSQIIKAA